MNSPDEFLQSPMKTKMDAGVHDKDCFFPFLDNGLKMLQCRLCRKIISEGDEVLCSVHHCPHAYHSTCIHFKKGFFSKDFKCPQHACFVCNRKNYLRCVRCFLAFHVKCSPWPKDVVLLPNRPGRAICWKHPSDWRLDKQHADPTKDLEEVFHRLPLPYVEEEFEIVDSIVNDVVEINNSEPTPYIHINSNVYLIKRKLDDENCECNKNRPFSKEKKIKVVKLKLCGWGAIALEFIEKGDFVVEYLGEVIDDVLCEQRICDMNCRGEKKFYLCGIEKDFIIDATFKGNSSRFINHSCDPNCKLEKWQVEGETRIGVFALRTIQSGEALTYDYGLLVQFEPVVKCYCGASKCRGFIGSRKKKSQTNFLNCVWGCRRMRSHKSIGKKLIVTSKATLEEIEGSKC